MNIATSSRRKGFTLVELLVVIAIIVALAALGAFLERAVHCAVVVCAQCNADSARFTLEIANVPTEENPRTGKNTALSVIAALRGLTSTLKVGT